MTLTNRMTRLFMADMHGLLDRLEEPEVVLRQAVRDMEEELARCEAQTAALRGDAARAGQRIERLDRELGELGAKLDLCLGNNNEELARGVLRKQLETERLRQAAVARQSEAGAATERAAREVAECKEKLADVRRRMELCLDELPLARAERGDDRDGGGVRNVTDDDVEIALLRAREQRGRSAANSTNAATRGEGKA